MQQQYNSSYINKNLIKDHIIKLEEKIRQIGKHFNAFTADEINSFKNITWTRIK